MPAHQACWLLLLHVCIRALMNITGPSRRSTLSSARHCSALPVMLRTLLAIAERISHAHRLARCCTSRASLDATTKWLNHFAACIYAVQLWRGSVAACLLPEAVHAVHADHPLRCTQLQALLQGCFRDYVVWHKAWQHHRCSATALSPCPVNAAVSTQTTCRIDLVPFNPCNHPDSIPKWCLQQGCLQRIVTTECIPTSRVQVRRGVPALHSRATRCQGQPSSSRGNRGAAVPGSCPSPRTRAAQGHSNNHGLGHSRPARGLSSGASRLHSNSSTSSSNSSGLSSRSSTIRRPSSQVAVRLHTASGRLSSSRSSHRRHQRRIRPAHMVVTAASSARITVAISRSSPCTASRGRTSSHSNCTARHSSRQPVPTPDRRPALRRTSSPPGRSRGSRPCSSRAKCSRQWRQRGGSSQSPSPKSGWGMQCKLLVDVCFYSSPLGTLADHRLPLHAQVWVGRVTQTIPPNYGIVDGDAFYVTQCVKGSRQPVVSSASALQQAACLLTLMLSVLM